ncbi:hypothetical protein [Parasphaerochaeta coccoides]|uniref:Glycoside hydrolase family 65 n=1 Tax=Parasphaerochaeta coccoides (strain ATCC BAA-1237 / DSM 17374 / SPN1) TaxID=760011 RepID=F4GKY3_PARC1|nr:hypothetical protein [Parasphaerochaeta coccoides]AEC01896.1 hypothetical protein Spico_0670 [Parasphaerochaeta coccoides DSM 17374]
MSKDSSGIDASKTVARNNPVLREIKTVSPLSIGNGQLAFTADPTGLQTFYTMYGEAYVPLCTMSQWGWHTTPAQGNGTGKYSLSDLEMTQYDFGGRTVQYPVEKKPGNEEVYGWLRENPHKCNLIRIGFRLDGKDILPDSISAIHQELYMYDGFLESQFSLEGVPCQVKSACAPHMDMLAFSIETPLLASRRLSVVFSFPYGSPDISGSDWSCPERHISTFSRRQDRQWSILRAMDNLTFHLNVQACTPARMERTGSHEFTLSATAGYSLEFTADFIHESQDNFKENKQEEDKNDILSSGTTSTVFTCAKHWWNSFWEEGGIIDLSGSIDIRAGELERRTILSLYLLAINCTGGMPPQETGLFCNSWYGKFHLEMHLWHGAFFPLWNHANLLMRSLGWYKRILPQARENARNNGYAGARWPKMVAYEGTDSPSPIAPLLVWQQPHVIYLLELLRRSGMKPSFMAEYWDVMSETATFMADYAMLSRQDGLYHLLPPLIPVQETHSPMAVTDPAFEIEYWHFALGIACAWARELGVKVPPKWAEVWQRIAPVPKHGGLYIAHADCPDTFTKFTTDHPSMLGACGVIPSERINPAIMFATLEKTMECWDYLSLWGWDFAMMAMTATRLGKPDTALDLLLCDTPKNSYEANGHNFQKSRNDLPAYLPGNGGLLFALALMSAGWDGCADIAPGFPKNGKWKVLTRNILPLP